jgi:hypothetical protein
MWAILFSDGALKLEDLDQIRNEKWIPVLCIRPRGFGNSTVLLFDTQETAYKFVRRNMDDKKWLKGAIELGDEDVADIKKKFRVEELSFPKRYDSHPEFEIGYEVIEFQTVIGVTYIRVKI